jgi:hypothetical protein
MGTKSFVQIEINADFTSTSSKMQFRSGVFDHFKTASDGLKSNGLFDTGARLYIYYTMRKLSKKLSHHQIVFPAFTGKLKILKQAETTQSNYTSHFQRKKYAHCLVER